MKKKLLIVFSLIILIISSFPAILFAEENVIPSERQLSRLVDNANLLTDGEVEELTVKLDEISERQQLDVVIITVEELGEGHTPTSLADDLFDYSGFGMGETRDGILLLLSMAERDWAISTTGYGIQVFTDAGQKYMTDNFLKYLSNGDYFEGFSAFADLSDEFITQARTDKPYDSGNMPKEPLSPMWILYSVIGGVVIAYIATTIMKRNLKTVAGVSEAENYFISDSLNMSESKDLFLYDVVTRQLIPKNNSSSGGSSTHTSSSGSSHGGSSGKF